jgi:hypothetical protein
MQKFELVDDEDSCCGLMHIVDNEQDYICRGYDDIKMIVIVDKLNLHDELVEAMTNLLTHPENGQIRHECYAILAKINGEK